MAVLFNLLQIASPETLRLRNLGAEQPSQNHFELFCGGGGVICRGKVCCPVFEYEGVF